MIPTVLSNWYFYKGEKPLGFILTVGSYYLRGFMPSDDNKWGFGQCLTVILLILPLLSTLESYHGQYTMTIRHLHSSAYLSSSCMVDYKSKLQQTDSQANSELATSNPSSGTAHISEMTIPEAPIPIGDWNILCSSVVRLESRSDPNLARTGTELGNDELHAGIGSSNLFHSTLSDILDVRESKLPCQHQDVRPLRSQSPPAASPQRPNAFVENLLQYRWYHAHLVLYSLLNFVIAMRTILVTVFGASSISLLVPLRLVIKLLIFVSIWDASCGVSFLVHKHSKIPSILKFRPLAFLMQLVGNNTFVHRRLRTILWSC